MSMSFWFMIIVSYIHNMSKWVCLPFRWRSCLMRLHIFSVLCSSCLQHHIEKWTLRFLPGGLQRSLLCHISLWNCFGRRVSQPIYWFVYKCDFFKVKIISINSCEFGRSHCRFDYRPDSTLAYQATAQHMMADWEADPTHVANMLATDVPEPRVT